MYLKEAFNPSTIEEAKNICISPSKNNPGKFEKETVFTINFLVDERLVFNDSSVLDFGCGVGRLSKAVISRLGCRVDGFDISQSMLERANEFVLSKNFKPVLYTKGMEYEGRFDVALSFFVLQHSEHPIEDIEFIHSILKDSGKLVLMNEPKRFVPVSMDMNRFVQWEDDGIDIEAEVSKKFRLMERYQYMSRTDKMLMVWEKI